jgi:hypothetical protein
MAPSRATRARASGRTGLTATAMLVAACGASSQNDAAAPACNGVSPANLAYEQTTAGQCPATPTILTGTGTVGTSCSDPTDCAPVCCTCPGSHASADVAECSNGNCLDGATACCLYALQCAQ